MNRFLDQLLQHKRWIGAISGALVILLGLWFAPRFFRHHEPAANSSPARRDQARSHKPVPRPTLSSSIPAPANTTIKTAPSTPLRQRRVMEKLMAGESVSLTHEQVEAYLKERGRSAAHLLAALACSGDKSYLEEAARRFPDDPQIQLAVLTRNLFPEERSRWLEALKKSMPESSWADYLSAREAFQAGQPQQALSELTAASLKPGLGDYSLEQVQAAEELYVSSGFTPAEAKITSTFGQRLPQLLQMRDLSRSMTDLATQYRQQGDVTTAESIASLGLTMIRQFNPDPSSGSMIQELVGIAMETGFLRSLDSNKPLEGTDQTVVERLAESELRRNAIKEIAQTFDPAVISNLSDAQLSEYIDRVKVYGEYNAALWLRNQTSRR